MGRPKKEQVPPGNPRFIEWIQQWLDEAKGKEHLTNMRFCYQRALVNLVKVHEPLAPKSLVQVNGIGPGIVKKVEQRVAEHLSAGGSMAELYQPGAAVPVREVEPAEVASSTSSQPPKRGRKNTGADEDADNASGAAAAPAKRTKKKAYVPAYRSGAYALLMALYENMLKGEQFMTKTRDLAQPYCDASFKDAEPGKQFYTAWNSMSSLITKQLVVKQGSPAKYYLTLDGQDLGEQLWEKSQSFAGDGSSTNRRPAVAAIPDDEMVEMDYDHAVKLGGYHGATQASVARIPTSTPVASASAATRPRPPATSPRSLPFQFWYISTERTRVRRKVDAEAKIDSGLPSSLGAKIEYHYLQANHAHAVHVLKATAVPDASGMMIGFMDDRHAPEQCPGVNAVELELGSKKSQAPAATSSVSHTPLSKATVQHSQAITKQRTSSTSQTTTSAVAATPIMPPPLPRKPPMTPSDSLKAAIALNCTLPDIPALPKNMSLTCEDDDAPAATVTASRTDITWQGPAIRLPQGRFEIQMLLDSRETRSRKDRTFFLDELRRLRVPCQSRALDVADVMWVAVPTADSYDMDELKYERRKQMFRQNDQQQLGLEDAPLDAGNLDGAQDIALDFLVERKRLDDLVGSIKEGRFQEQKRRLLNSGASHIFYIVEDYSTHTVEQFGRDALRTAMATVQTLTGMYVKRTTGPEDTIRFLAQLTQHIRRFYMNQDIYAIPPQLLDKDTFLEFKRTVESRDRRKYHVPYSIFAELCSKSSNSMLGDVWFKQLNCIRGVSTEKAQTIVQNLINALRACATTDERMLLLRELNGPIQRQNLGEAIRRKIVDLFCSSVYPEIAVE